MAQITIILDTERETLRDVVERGFGWNVQVKPTRPVDPTRDDPPPIVEPETSADASRAALSATDRVMAQSIEIATNTAAAVEAAMNRASALEAAKLGPMDGNRKRGERPGGKRRTNAQIADDDRWLAYLETIKAKGNAALAESDKSHVAQAEDAGETARLPTQPESAGDTGQAISSGGPRVDRQEAAQDARDESAERAPGVTLDDLRRAVGAYQKKFGMDRAVADTPRILGKPVIAHGKEEIPAAIAKMQAAMISEKPSETKFTPSETKFTPSETKFTPSETKFTPVATPPAEALFEQHPEPPAPPAYPSTIEGVKGAMIAYGKKYDGTDDLKQMKLTGEDMPKVLTQTFGPGVVAPSRIPADAVSYGRAIEAVLKAIEANPFGRAAK